jgi:hypothetical protein
MSTIYNKYSKTNQISLNSTVDRLDTRKTYAFIHTSKKLHLFIIRSIYQTNRPPYLKVNRNQIVYPGVYQQ